jgi:hypothetical protein
MLDVNTSLNNTWGESLEFIDIKFLNKNIEWLGNGKTSENIISILKNSL